MERKMLQRARAVGVFFLLLLVSGCVAGQKINMAYDAGVTGNEELSDKIQVVVEDVRPFVVNKDKDPSYIGHYRAGFGNTWDVKTEGEVPLADKVRKDLVSDLVALHFTKGNNLGNGAKVLKVSIVDWNFDTYMNGKFWYDCDVVVTRGDQTLASAKLKDKIVINGSFWVGAKYAFEREMPRIYQEIIHKMVRDNKEVLAALKR